MILVITREGDRHGWHMVELLRSRGKRVIPFDFATFPVSTEISFTPICSTISVGGVRFDTSELTAVLYRREAVPQPPSCIHDQDIREYIIQESKSFLDSLSDMTNCRWVSHPDTILVANRKPLQLQHASALGFTIPRTLITNSPGEAANFIRNLPGAVAVKSLTGPGITVGQGVEEKSYALYTRGQSVREIIGKIGRVRNCPTVLQEYIEKAFELRITVVGQQTYACAIHSQASPHTKEDWRRYDLEHTPHRSYELPTDMRSRCVQLVHGFGLQFGCIDMIVTPDGSYVFLELNPNGQWLWIEQLTGLPISEALANLLTIL